MHIKYLNPLYPLWHVLDDSHACLVYITSCNRCCSIIKVCSYNLFFNKATSNNDTRYLSNNVCLTTHVCLTTFLINGSDHAEYSRKSQFMRDKCYWCENKKGLCERMEAIWPVVLVVGWLLWSGRQKNPNSQQH